MDVHHERSLGWRHALSSPADWMRQQLELIDRQWIHGERASDLRLVLNVVSTSAVLFLLNYVAMDRKIQTQVSWFFIEVFDLWNYSATGWILPEHMALAQRIAWVGFCVLFYTGIPLLFHVVVLRKPLADLGLSVKGYVRHLPVYVALFVPVGLAVFAVSYSPSFQATYPFYHNPVSLRAVLLWELFYGLQFFSLEVFFRGFMLAEAKLKYGWRSVLFMVVPYVMIHFGKPGAETVGSLIAGGVLGLLALRTGSIWGGVTIHIAVAWSMDIASMLQRGVLRQLPW